MDFDREFANPEKEKEGVWIDYRNGSSVKIARVGNPNFTRIQDAKQRPHIRKIRNGTLSTAVETRILCESMAESILLDWKGFQRGGKELKYSSDIATELMLQSIDFRNDVAEMSAEEENFYLDVAEDSAKN
jgi:hypothetical protein